MASLNDFLDPNINASDITHSSGYVSGGGIGGGGGGLSMDRRKQLLNQPRVVGAYTRSHLGRRFGAAKARTADNKARVYDASSDSFDDAPGYGKRKKSSIKDKSQIDSSIAKRQHFVEPPSRAHDPYA